MLEQNWIKNEENYVTYKHTCALDIIVISYSFKDCYLYNKHFSSDHLRYKQWSLKRSGSYSGPHLRGHMKGHCQKE